MTTQNNTTQYWRWKSHTEAIFGSVSRQGHFNMSTAGRRGSNRRPSDWWMTDLRPELQKSSNHPTSNERSLQAEKAFLILRSSTELLSLYHHHSFGFHYKNFNTRLLTCAWTVCGCIRVNAGVIRGVSCLLRLPCSHCSCVTEIRQASQGKLGHICARVLGPDKSV